MRLQRVYENYPKPIRSAHRPPCQSYAFILNITHVLFGHCSISPVRTCSVKWLCLHQTWWIFSAAWDSAASERHTLVKAIAYWPNEVVHLRVQHNNMRDYSKEIKGRRRTAERVQKAGEVSSMQDRGRWHLVLLRQSSLFARAERKGLKDSCARKRSASGQQETVQQSREEGRRK